MHVNCVHLWESTVALLAFIDGDEEAGLIILFKVLEYNLISLCRTTACTSLFLYMNIAFVIVSYSPTLYVDLRLKIQIALHVCDCRRRISWRFAFINRMTDWHRSNTSLWICWEDADSIQSSSWVSSAFKSECWSRYRASYSKLPQKAILLSG